MGLANSCIEQEAELQAKKLLEQFEKENPGLDRSVESLHRYPAYMTKLTG